MMKKRILVVEDQVDIRRILRDLLTNADYEIIEAENGEEALAAAAAAHFADREQRFHAMVSWYFARS